MSFVPHCRVVRSFGVVACVIVGTPWAASSIAQSPNAAQTSPASIIETPAASSPGPIWHMTPEAIRQMQPDARRLTNGEDPPPQPAWIARHVRPEYGHAAVFDRARNRTLFIGGFAGLATLNDVWVLSSDPAGWSRLEVQGEPPRPRGLHTAVLDSVGDRVIVFGGYGADEAFYMLNDVWILSLSGTPTWTKVEVPDPPIQRAGHNAIFDAARGRMIIFGGFHYDGFDNYFFNDVWELTLGDTAAWTPIAPSGVPPQARVGAAAVLDPVRDRMIVFGGYNGGFDLNDTWSLSLAAAPAWTLQPAGTDIAPRESAVAVYDPYRDRIMLSGGANYDVGVRYPEVWGLPLFGGAQWQLLVSGGPSGRELHAGVFDPILRRMLIDGGIDVAEELAQDTWELNVNGNPTWSRLVAAGEPPSGRFAVSGIHDVTRGRFVIFGGFDRTFTTFNKDDVWALDAAGWTQLFPPDPLPLGRGDHSAVLDPLTDRMLIFGGNGGFVNGFSRFNDTWAFSLASPAWEEIVATGEPPPPRQAHTAIFDPVRRRMIVYGGIDSLDHALGDVWALNLEPTPAWTRIEPLGEPPVKRLVHSAIYDPVRDAMVVFGGYDSLFAKLNDLWVLSLSGPPIWAPLEPGVLIPGPRGGHSAVYDPVDDRMVIFGGITYNPPGDLNDAWSFDLGGSTGWTPLVPPGIWPSPRYSFACAYDPAHKTMEIFGGGPYLRDVWELPLGDTTTTAVLLARFDARAVSGGIEVRWEFGDPGRIAESWIERAANGAGPWVEAALDRRREGESEIATDRTVTDGETRFYRLVARERGGALLHFGPVSATAGVTPVRASLDAPSPNPARGAVQLGFTLPAPAVIRLSIFDVAGREVATLLDGEQRAGRFAVTWSGEFGTGGAARPGLYFARLRTTHGTLMRRIAIAR